MGALLRSVGITSVAEGSTGEKVGIFALAYAAHKAASPIRFPPTVALTPVVASWLGKGKGGNGAGLTGVSGGDPRPASKEETEGQQEES